MPKIVFYGMSYGLSLLSFVDFFLIKFLYIFISFVDLIEWEHNAEKIRCHFVALG